MDEEYYQLIIVDDEEQARRSLAKYLDWHQLGFHVAATLEDGSDAIAYLQKHPVNTILTDIQMFQVSGLELAQWVQAQRSDIRVVILPGYDEIEYVHAAIESEAVDFLVKPVMKDALIRAFEKVRKKLDEQKAGRYSLRHLTSQALEEKENALACAAAVGNLAALEGAKQWIAAHLSEDFSLEDVCSALYVSKGHLCREFKKATDDTVMGYVEKQRMEKGGGAAAAPSLQLCPAFRAGGL